MKRFVRAAVLVLLVALGIGGIAHAAFTYRQAPIALLDSATGVRVSVGSQPAPTAKTVTAVLTAAELLTGIVTTTGATAPSVHQLPLGTALDTAITMNVGESFDFTVINTGTGAGDDATITVNTGVTIVGNPTVGALTDTTIISGSGTFRVRKTAVATYVVYRLS